MTTAIKVESLSKKYTISHQKNQRYQYKTLQESIFSAERSAFKWFCHPLSNTETSEQEYFWVLKGIISENNQGHQVKVTVRNWLSKSFRRCRYWVDHDLNEH